MLENKVDNVVNIKKYMRIFLMFVWCVCSVQIACGVEVPSELLNSARMQAKIAIENRDLNKALAAYDSLSVQYVENIEVANDMSVILAAMGQLDEARALLENAIGRDPKTGSAFLNLREILARQAAISYTKALKRDSPDNLIALKSEVLDLTRTRTALVRERGEKSDGQIAEATLPKLGSEVPMSIVKDSREEIREMLAFWADAWSNKDFEAYIGFYGAKFSNKRYKSLKKWSKFRKPRIKKRGSIKVKIDKLRFKTVSNKTAKISFEQRYKSGSTRLFTVKTMELINDGNGWKIIFEG